MLTERWFAKVYGWPPEVTRRLDLESLEWYPLIEQAERRADELRQQQKKR